MLLELVPDLKVRLAHFYERLAVRAAGNYAAVVVRQHHDGCLCQVRPEDALAARVEAVAVNESKDRLRLLDHEHAH
ncbi:hypothetical protein D3C84_1249800 [compost metagenome]